ncbi:ion transporter [Mycoplasmopsis ciconiae]|uniref:Ion transporter n=1 Tax=Mycoplasmopsis ciconiae TaxID=561067 RepID=A0ABU7MKJ8_9BACT|nr:ion transporter [Mycoplasmopsis ciconiae]
MTKKLYFSNVLEAISVISTSDSDIDKKIKKNKRLIKILRNIYLVIILFTVIFSFASFAITTQDKNNEMVIKLLKIITISSFFIFSIDYLLHWISFPLRANKDRGFWLNFLIFPFTGIGIILLLCVLPSIHVLEYFDPELSKNTAISYFKTITFFRVVRLILILKVFAPFRILINVFRDQRVILTYIFLFILILIVVFALIIWRNEQEWLKQTIDQLKKPGQVLFGASEEKINEYINDNYSNVVNNFGNAIYFATITLTTIGYGDFVPHAETSKTIVIIVSLLGIALFAIPSGVIAGSVLTEMNKAFESKKTFRSSSSNKEKKEMASHIKAEIQEELKELQNNNIGSQEHKSQDKE